MPERNTQLENADNLSRPVPPNWPRKLLRFFLKKEYLEEIEGDMEELFAEYVGKYPLRKARRMYSWEMIRLLRPALIKNMEIFQRLKPYPMLGNYFKVSTRNLMKNPLNSFINVFGLSAAIGICIFGYAFANWTFNTDQFHEHKNEVYLVTFLAERDGTPQQYGRTPRPLGEMLKADFAHIKKVCRVEDRNVVMKFEDGVFHEHIRFVDPEFLQMFTFPLKWGAASSLADVNSIVLSEEMSVKYFGEENPVGLSILMKFDKDRSKAFKITGVAREFPASHTVEFDFLINFENLREANPGYNFHDWTAFVNATLIQVNNAADLASVEQGMSRYKRLQNEASQKEWAIASFAFEPLATLHQRSEDIRDDISYSSKNNYSSVIYMVVIGIFLLALACFNYINIAIVSAAKRLKEIGVRKSIGAKRSTVIVQFLSENIVITFFAVILGVALAWGFFIPGFEYMWHFSMGFRLDDPILWIYLPAILIFTTVASGIYPSLYISSFQVSGILRGSVKFGHRNPITKVLLCLQLILSCVFITGAVMFTQNTNYMSQRSWGYDPAEALYAIVPDQEAYEQLYVLMSGEADVLKISGSRNHLGKNHTTTVLNFPDREFEVDHLAVDAGYFETMGLQLKDGRVFNDHEGSDRQAVIINERMAVNLKWEQPVGQQFRIDSTQYEVIGVLKEFHSYSFSRPVRPTIFTVAQKTDYKFLSMRVRPGSEAEAYKALQASWAGLFPEIPFEGGYQEDVWGGYYDAIKIHRTVWGVFAFIAVTLAGLGLYGLMTLNVTARTKEFSIRKVLGAGWKNIAGSISNQYLLLFTIALVAGIAIGHPLMKLLIETAYAYHKPVDLSAVSIAAMLLILIVLMTVFTQIKKVFDSNPVNGLKVE